MTLRLASGSNTVDIDLEQGGRISSLVIRNRERIVGAPCSDGVEPALAWGSFLMAPFVGRVKNGLLEWRGRTVQLRRNHGPHAIHGTIFDEKVEVLERREDYVAIGCTLDRGRWPFGGRVVQRYTLSGDCLVIEADLEADEPMPAEIGWHPWFVRDGDMRVAVNSDRNLHTAPDLIPTGATVPVDEQHDLRAGARVDALALDDVFVAARPPAFVRWPDLELRMDFEAPVGTFVVYIHPTAVCVEPLTSWPDAVRLEAQGVPGTGLVNLEAGQRLSAATTWSWRSR
jgi:aldose 1-epimerase